MHRDTVVFSLCSFLLGLIIGSLLIGPKLARPAAPTPTPTPAPQPPAAGANPMDAVRQQIAALKATLERDPRNFEALVQLGNMYMDAAKYPQAVDYYERALAVREDPNVRVDLGISYKQNAQPEKALAAFHRASEDAPGQWQAMFNEAIVLGELRRFDEARALTSKLQKLKPDDPQVQRLAAELAKQ
jgi:Flp pilus assembly protein TadD